jgi:hypothetical protein
MLALAACQQAKSDDRICFSPPQLRGQPGETVQDQIAVTNECIHRWAYRLSRSSASTRDVTDATIGACREAIDRVFVLGVKEARPDGFADSVWRQYQEDFREQALFRTVQARAGHCEIN